MTRREVIATVASSIGMTALIQLFRTPPPDAPCPEAPGPAGETLSWKAFLDRAADGTLKGGETVIAYTPNVIAYRGAERIDSRHVVTMKTSVDRHGQLGLHHVKTVDLP